jgi:hypothetical protein
MNDIKQKIIDGELIPFLGMGIFKNTKATDGSVLPYDSDSMILAMNNGRAMSQRLMYEYTRAAMSLEQRRGRDFIVQMTNHIYSSKEYEIPYTYKFLEEIKPKYVVDTTLDDSLLRIYQDTKHFLITGISRITAENDRFIVYQYNIEDKQYVEVSKEELNTDIPILFKPMGCMTPDKNFIISDADFVDWLTEAMGGYALPQLLKEYRKDKSYMFLGIDFSHDTYRMVSNEITIDLKGGIVVDDKNEQSKKENKFLDKHKLELINKNCDDFLKEL